MSTVTKRLNEIRNQELDIYRDVEQGVEAIRKFIKLRKEEIVFVDKDSLNYSTLKSEINDWVEAYKTLAGTLANYGSEIDPTCFDIKPTKMPSLQLGI